MEGTKNKIPDKVLKHRKGERLRSSSMMIRQRSMESLRDFLARFRAEVAAIPNLKDELEINYLAAGVDKSRHAPLLEVFFKKNHKTLQAAMTIFEHD